MKKSLLYIWMLPLLMVSIAVAGIRAHPTTTIGVEPDSIVDPDLVPGSTFTVNIMIRDFEDLAGIEFKLGYDTSVLTATNIEYGGIFGDTYFPFISEIYDDEGYLHYSIMEYFGEPGSTGDGIAAIITFSVDSSGESVLDLYSTKIGDSAPVPNPIVHDASDGFFSNGTFHDIAVTNVRAYPTEVEASELVTINVTVTNEGDYGETFTVIVYADIEPYEYIYENPFPPYGRVIDVKVTVGDEITVGTQTVTDLAPGNTTTPTFTWDTTGVEEGIFTISANVTLVDDDTRDNLFIDGIDGNVTVTALLHDIAITSVVPSPTEVTVGENVTINVTVENEGNFNETFDVTVYYDGTAIDTKTNVSLENGTSTTLTFTWDTTDVAKDTYTIKATASVVTGETDTADNTRTSEGTVKIQEAAPAPNILIYAAVAAAAIVVIAAAVIYFVKIRK